ncbi:MAG: GNAT family N-acetyltransferase [Steroidobacteraceae bacterium]
MNPTLLQVTYMESLGPPQEVPTRDGPERIRAERLLREEYLDLYRRVGAPLRWDQRLRMSADELDRLLAGPACSIYVLRDGGGDALGFCEFDRGAAPQVELKNFGLVPGAQGRGLGSWLLARALVQEWQAAPARIWLHTDTWDHSAAIRMYERMGFRKYRVQMEPAAPL